MVVLSIALRILGITHWECLISVLFPYFLLNTLFSICFKRHNVFTMHPEILLLLDCA